MIILLTKDGPESEILRIFRIAESVFRYFFRSRNSEIRNACRNPKSFRNSYWPKLCNFDRNYEISFYGNLYHPMLHNIPNLFLPNRIFLWNGIAQNGNDQQPAYHMHRFLLADFSYGIRNALRNTA